MAWKKIQSGTITAVAAVICAGLLASCGTSGSAADTTIDMALVSDTSQNTSQNTSNTLTQTTVSNTDTTDSMPENPSQDLPDSISSSIPNNATVISPDLAVTKDGTVKDLETGKTVTDPTIVGTEDTPPDPLAATDGTRFIPVSVKTVRKAVEQQAQSTTTASSAKTSGSVKNAVATSASTASNTTGSVKLAALQNNSYGAYWGTYGGTQAFFERGGTLFAQEAKGVIDVSEWQGTIDWTKVRSSGVEGAIIRVGFGWNGRGRIDKQAIRNLQECKRLGIPFGIYWFSYAHTPSIGTSEAETLIRYLKQAGISASDLSYPVFYDLEGGWTWYGHVPPTSPDTYNGIANAWWSVMQSAGYNNLGIYSGANYLNTNLNSANLHAKTKWVANYGGHVGFTFQNSIRGWQYMDNGRVSGISGNVDMSAFTGVYDVRSMSKVTIPNGTYYINSMLKDSSGIDIPGASKTNGARTQLYQANGSSAQKFVFTRQSDGSYVITNASSGKALDVSGANAGNNAVVQQYTPNGTTAQRWYIRDTGKGYCIQSALGNWVLDVSGASSANGTRVALYSPNMSTAQRFTIASATATIPTNVGIKISSASKSSLAMDVTGASDANGARIQIYNANGTSAQVFKAKSVGNGIYTLTNDESGKLLDVAGGSTTNGGVVQQYQSTGASAQHWSLIDYGSGKIALTSNTSGKAVDIPGNKASASVKLQTYSLNGTKAQQWTVTKTLTERDKLNNLAAQNKNALADGTVTIVSALSASKVLDVTGASRTNGANVQLYRSNGTGAQRWVVSHDAQGYVTLRNVTSGKVLDVTGASTSNGTNVQQYASNGTWAQKWIAVKNSDGTITFHSALKYGLVLDVTGASTKDGTNVQMYASNGTKAQRWVRK